MPAFDKPLPELWNYQGINPKPADFEEYWDKALADLQLVDSQVELRPAEFRAPFAECFHLFFTGVGGSRVHAKYLRPKHSAAPHPAILWFHGYGGTSADWSDFLSYVAMGYSVAALDCRGQGGLSEDLTSSRGNTHRGHIIRGLDDAPEKLAFRQIFLDTAQLAKIVAGFPEVDSHRLGAAGGSQGGALCIACAALAPEIKRLAPVHPFLSDYLRVWQMDLAVDAYAELTYYFRIIDPLHEREQEVFTKLGYIDVQYLAPRIQGKVMMAITLMDKICPPSTQFAVFNKIQSPKEAVIYPDYAHERLPRFQDKTFEFLTQL